MKDRPTLRRGRWRAAGSFLCWLGLAIVCAALESAEARAGDFAGAQKLYRNGKYDECAQLIKKTNATAPQEVQWWELQIRAEMVRGKYDEALKTYKQALDRFSDRISLQLLGATLYRQSGKAKEADALLTAIEKQVLSNPRKERSAAERVALGRFLLQRGADASKVLSQFFSATIKSHPDFVEAYFAAAELALGKNDYALAAKMLQQAPRAAAEDPRYHCLLSRALASGDREEATKALNKALSINPNHVDSLLFKADHLITAEHYDEAGKALDLALSIDPLQPRALAYRAVIAHLKGDSKGELAFRNKALSRWSTNPEVDHTIGRKLAQDYRFKEAAAYQRNALKMDRDYMPARIQLCQTLLRLGEEEEGWKLAKEIFARDGYNVFTYNLINLRDRLTQFRTLESEGFLLRMDAREAELYGQQALRVLRRARRTLTKKYGVKLDQIVTVEIFPQKRDFAVRTFGMPGADGYLGVCFGPVITAISPAAQGEDPSNWEAVLWHEFCHTVTLHRSRNRMPRWLSEGISVYEELQENPAWGQWLTPRYRTMILGEDLTPVSELTSAFLSPKSPEHVQFAYFESALVVDYIVHRYGLETLKAILSDLGNGLPINEALVRRTTALKRLDADFAAYARKKAKDIAPGATWEEPDLPATADSAALSEWLQKHPKSFPGLQRLGMRLAEEKKWLQAEKVLKDLQKLYPAYIGSNSAYELLAIVYHNQGKIKEERAILEDLAHLDGDAAPVYTRLMEICEKAKDWHGVANNARRLRACNPLTPLPHRTLARAAQQLGNQSKALAASSALLAPGPGASPLQQAMLVLKTSHQQKARRAALNESLEAYSALLALGVPDLGNIHYQRAELLRQLGQPEKARREVLKALEEAPRFRKAHTLLLQLVERGNEKKSNPTSRPSTRGPTPDPEEQP